MSSDVCCLSINSLCMKSDRFPWYHRKKIDCHHFQPRLCTWTQLSNQMLPVSFRLQNYFQWCHECTPRMERHLLSHSFNSQLVYQFWSIFTNFWLSSIWSGNSLLPPIPWLMVPSDHDQKRGSCQLLNLACPVSLRTASFFSFSNGNEKELVKGQLSFITTRNSTIFFSVSKLELPLVVKEGVNLQHSFHYFPRIKCLVRKSYSSTFSIKILMLFSL